MNAPLEETLALAVPLWIERLRAIDPGTRIALAAEDAQTIASHGDDILYRSGRRGRTAEAFNALARGLAAAAFQPGGVRAFGQAWCAAHPAPWPDGAPVCPACRAAEPPAAAVWVDPRPPRRPAVTVETAGGVL